MTSLIIPILFLLLYFTWKVNKVYMYVTYRVFIRLVRSFQIQRCRSFSERVGPQIILLESLQKKRKVQAGSRRRDYK